MKKTKTISSIPAGAYVSSEDQRAIFRLTEQAQLLLEEARAMPKARVQQQKAQDICNDIQRILQSANDLIVFNLFELTVAPKLIRLSQDLKLQKKLNKVKQFSVGDRIRQSVKPPSSEKKQTINAKNNGEIIHGILQDLQDMLK